MRIILLITAIVSFHLHLNSQALVSLDPPFPSGDSPVTVTFNADQGNAQLANLPAGTVVYAHTGVTVNGSDWQYVVGNWGTVDNRVAMTRIGMTNQYTLTLSPSIRQWYSTNNNGTETIPSGAVISQLCMVFRNATGTLEGKTSAGGDIFVPISTSSYSASITSHNESSLLLNSTQTVNFLGQASAASQLDFLLNGENVATAASATQLPYSFNAASIGAGMHQLIFRANNGTTTLRDTILITVHAPTQVAALPSFGQEGISYPNNTTAYLQLRAPFKNFIYVRGDFNDWAFDPAYQMKRTPDGQFYWIEIPNLTPGTEYRFQYYIDDVGLRVTDPYVEKVLDPFNDQFISEAIYPNLIPYPTGKTEGIVGILNTSPTQYQWDNSYTWTRKPNSDLIIYELLVRDFDENKDFQSVIDRIPYLKSLGVNAVQFMPLTEFEGNVSWGYNPSFFFAVDKAYGTKDKLKEMVDSLHKNGMAVILDVVYNHSFGQNPLVQMYFNPDAGPFGQPTAQSPWFNQIERHPFNVGYDFNHESAATKYYVEKCIKHWLEEYKMDGYRFDLSKGFTQNNTLGNVGLWGQYDQSRVNILTNYANVMRSVAPDVYVIFEHFSDNSEEVVYANNGIMTWGNGVNTYNEATMGFIGNSNLYNTTAFARGWNSTNNYGLVTYAESHDEERLMYKNLQFGNQVAGYSTRELNTAIARMGLAAAFLIPLPGPKMMWQFQELGYDFSINYCENGTINESCRTSPKPIRWDYYSNANRRQLFNVWSKVNNLKNCYPEVFRDLGVFMDLGPAIKKIRHSNQQLNVAIIGNFDVVAQNGSPNFQSTGMWYNYLSGDSLNVTDQNMSMNLQPGEFHIYLDRKINCDIPIYEIPVSADDLDNKFIETALAIYPNPASDFITIVIPGFESNVADIQIFDLSGRLVKAQGGINHNPLVGVQFNVNDLPSGAYFVRGSRNGKVFFGKFIKS
jgi:1,4-alpha-glucan branching enzyme